MTHSDMNSYAHPLQSLSLLPSPALLPTAVLCQAIQHQKFVEHSSHPEHPICHDTTGLPASYPTLVSPLSPHCHPQNSHADPNAKGVPPLLLHQQHLPPFHHTPSPCCHVCAACGHRANRDRNACTSATSPDSADTLAVEMGLRREDRLNPDPAPDAPAATHTHTHTQDPH